MPYANAWLGAPTAYRPSANCATWQLAHVNAKVGTSPNAAPPGASPSGSPASENGSGIMPSAANPGPSSAGKPSSSQRTSGAGTPAVANPS